MRGSPRGDRAGTRASRPEPRGSRSDHPGDPRAWRHHAGATRRCSSALATLRRRGVRTPRDGRSDGGGRSGDRRVVAPSPASAPAPGHQNIDWSSSRRTCHSTRWLVDNRGEGCGTAVSAPPHPPRPAEPTPHRHKPSKPVRSGSPTHGRFDRGAAQYKLSLRARVAVTMPTTDRRCAGASLVTTQEVGGSRSIGGETRRSPGDQLAKTVCGVPSGSSYSRLDERVDMRDRCLACETNASRSTSWYQGGWSRSSALRLRGESRRARRDSPRVSRCA